MSPASLPTVRAYGDTALLAELPDVAAVIELAQALSLARQRGGLPQVVDLIPAARTVLAQLRPGADLAGARAAILALAANPPARPLDRAGGPAEVVIPVRYDGPDLAEVARLTGLTREDVVAAHTGTPWRCAFTGFAPGFGYLFGGDRRLAVPRRAEPRPSVPAGSVALAGGHSGVYPSASPGGWQLIGRTDVVLWDLNRDPPALVTPGTQVRFEAVDPGIGAAPSARPTPAALPRPGRRADPPGGRAEPRTLAASLEVLATGPLTLVQDLGRPGLAHLGVGHAGAADRGALALANRLVANPPGAAGLEVLLGGLQLLAHQRTLVAVTGAPAPTTVDGLAVGHGGALALDPGQVLSLGLPATGLRSYLAVRGGVAAEPTLGSCSRDTLARVGPEPLAVGQHVPIGPAPGARPVTDGAWRPAPPARPAQEPPEAPARPLEPTPARGDVVLRVTPGPRLDWLADATALESTPWTVSPRTDRVGVRVSGAPLRRAPAYLRAELASEGATQGAVQVPPAGEPVVLGVDHPLTGGYPVVAVVVDADLDLLAQARPGQRVLFQFVGSSLAYDLDHER